MARKWHRNNTVVTGEGGCGWGKWGEGGWVSVVMG